MSLIPIHDWIKQCTKFISESLFQVLISDANGESAMITNSKDIHPKASSSKNFEQTLHQNRMLKWIPDYLQLF